MVDSNHTCLAVISLNSAVKKMRIINIKYFKKCVNALRKHSLDILLMT